MKTIAPCTNPLLRDLEDKLTHQTKAELHVHYFAACEQQDQEVLFHLLERASDLVGIKRRIKIDPGHERITLVSIAPA